MKSYPEPLLHILDEIRFLMESSKGLSYEHYVQDEIIRRAFVRSIEIIGEATKRLSPAIKDKNPSIPWKEMAGMRDKLIHHYFEVDYELVWEVVQNEIPKLKENLERIRVEKDL